MTTFPRRQAACLAHCSILLLSLLGSLAAASLVPHAFNHVVHKPLVAPFEQCKRLFKKDPSMQQVKEFTRLHMEWSIAARQYKYIDNILHYRSHPEEHEPGFNVTFAHPLSDAALQSHRHVAGAVAGAAQHKLDQLLKSMKDAGILAAGVQKLPPACLAARLDAAHYPERVAVSFTMQYYKQREFPHAMVQSIVNCNNTLPIELLVNIDHPQDVALWSEYVANTSGLVIPVISDNIHEARAFNRLARMARGHVIITAQDDDAYPQDCEWLNRVVNVFKAYPKIGLLGLRRRTPCRQAQELGFGDAVFHDREHNLDFQFESLVDASPFALRASVYHEVGGWDETQAAKGMCGILTDWELVLRVWAAGHWVAYLNNPPKLQVAGQSNSRESPDQGSTCWRLQMSLAGHVWFNRWTKEIEADVCKKALQLNCQLLQLKPDRATTEYNETEKCDALRRAGDLLPLNELQTLHHRAAVPAGRDKG